MYILFYFCRDHKVEQIQPYVLLSKFEPKLLQFLDITSC